MIQARKNADTSHSNMRLSDPREWEVFFKDGRVIIAIYRDGPDGDCAHWVGFDLSNPTENLPVLEYLEGFRFIPEDNIPVVREDHVGSGGL